MNKANTYAQRMKAISVALATVAYNFGETMAATAQAVRAFNSVLQHVQIVPVMWSPAISKGAWLIVWTLRMKKRNLWIIVTDQ